MRDVYLKYGHIFEEVYWKVIAQTTIPENRRLFLHEKFRKIWLDGLPAKAASHAVASVEPGVWNWGEFERYWILSGEIPVNATPDNMHQFDVITLPDLLIRYDRQTLFELYDHYKVNNGKRPTGRFKNADLIEMILSSISHDDKITLNEVLLEHERETGKRTYKDGYFMEMSIMLFLRISRITHNNMDKARRGGEELTRLMPYRMFRFGDTDLAPDECRSRHGMIYRHDDPELEEIYPPCEFIDCMCHVVAMSERDVLKHDRQLLLGD